jgi:HK97 family phage prohead protease
MTHRAYSTIQIKTFDEAKRTFTGIASTPTPDRMGDVVEPKGAKFKLPIPLLWQHDAADPIGWVRSAKITAAGIEVEGEIANVDGGPLKDRLTNAWQMMRAGLVRGLSIGFRALKDGVETLKDGGLRFKQWEWLELSAVTIPANQEASITTIRSLSTPPPGVPGRRQ